MEKEVPQEYREELEEGKGVDNLFPEDIAKLSDRDLQNVVIIIISRSFVPAIMNELFNTKIGQLRFEPFKGFSLLAVVVLFLQEVEKVQFRLLLFVEVCDEVSSSVSLLFLVDVNVAGLL